MNVNDKKKVIFLTGAGASVEAGVCTSEKITEILVNYSSYCPTDDSVAVENALRYVQLRIADHLRVRAADVNFEYILGALAELVERDRYPVMPLFGEGDTVIKKLEGRLALDDVISRLYALLRELLFLRKSVDYLHPLKAFLGLSKPLDFFTLNYDLSLETAFDGLSYTTGYKKRKEELPIWDPAEFDLPKYVVRLFKLHGSLNWGRLFQCPPPPTSTGPTGSATREAERYIAAYPQSVEFDPFPVGSVEPPSRTRGMVSLMNFGTRKDQLYALGQFTILFDRFLKSLGEARICVVAGYSFRDDRINRMIEEAVVSRRGDLHLIVVDPRVYRIWDENLVLRECFARLKWGTAVPKSLGEVLKDGSLMALVSDCLKAPRTGSESPRHLSAEHQEDAGPSKTVNPQIVLEAWRAFEITCGLAYFWVRFLAPRLNELEHCKTKAEAKEVGSLLLPLLTKVRDLCWRVNKVYGAMNFTCYPEEHVRAINDRPRPTDSRLEMDMVRRWLPKVGWAVSDVFHKCHGSADEFRSTVTNPSAGKEVGAPSNFSLAELIIRDTVGRLGELIGILNDIYKGAGYEEPFGNLIRRLEPSSETAVK